jgi:uncharacterized protein YbaP (TraB family)
MLWKWYKDDPQVCHYIFGTMHTASENAYKFVALAEKYIVSSALYAAEMDLHAATGSDLMSHFRLEDGNDLASLYKPKHYTKMRKVILKSFGIDINGYKDFSPFFITNMLSGLCAKPVRPQALDHHLWKFALEAGKELAGLESMEDQISILGRIPMDFQVRSLRSAADNISSFRKKINTLDDQYGRGDVKGLYFGARSSLGVIRQLMTTERNLKMTEKLLSLSSAKPTFASAGAAHMYGRDGILAHLKRHGYKVKSVIN